MFHIMSEERGTHSDTGGAAKPAMRDSLIAAAFQLFLERGFEQTTIDDIVALAGVGRRSFFRYFPSKEDVVFPDHERCLTDMTEFLQQQSPDGDPVAHVCDAARLVLRMYAENPAFSVQRYRLTKKVPGLRAHELSVVWRYERTLAEYLRARYAARPDGTLRSDVIAASVVAAHNHALRSWLRSGGRGDAIKDVDHALDYVRDTWSEDPAGRGIDGRDDKEDVIVLISRRKAPMWRVIQGIEAALDEA